MKQTLGNAVITLFLLVGAFSITVGPLNSVALAQSPQDAEIKADVINKALNQSRFKDVKVNVENGIVTLEGTVDLFDIKAEADRRTHRIKNVKAVDNDIQVAGPEIPDSELQNKLITAISFDRVGYGTTAFNAIGVNVQNGVATLTGTAYGPVDADSAVAVAANTKGVKDVVNDISVDPVSPMDDRIRLATFRAIYSFPSLNKYAINPAKPIRISVQNGNVTLFGVVDSEADKNAAGIRANTVPGVFHVTNNLMVAGQPERQ
jgi:hyperosmotically inducible periplasmic protein